MERSCSLNKKMMRVTLVLFVWFFIFIVHQTRSFGSNINPNHPILGQWQYESYILNGVEFPKPNPNLEIEFHFYPDGVSRLFWYRSNDKGFCDRYAHFSATDRLIHEIIFWVNPNNRAECGGDPDMQLGRSSQTPYKIDQQGRLLTRVYVADWDVWYVWKKPKD